MKRFCFALLLLIFIINQTFAQSSTFARDYVRKYDHEILGDFMDFLAIQNVASDLGSIRLNAKYLMAFMSRRELSPQLLETEDKNAPPAIYGEYKSPNAKKTIVFYAHYDGQPADPKQWTVSPPWNPVILSNTIERGGIRTDLASLSNLPINPENRIYARSASDDKAGVFAIITALDAIKKAGIQPSVNIKFFFEGEEEAGSSHLAEILTRHKDLLNADAWIICDGPVHQSGKKQVVFGVRGDTNVDVTVYGATRPLHSGHYGNWSPNPALTLVKLLSSMKDENGVVTVKGWYDDVEPLGAKELQAIKDAPQYDDEIKKQLGLKRTEGNGKSLLELINQPSLNINGMASGDVGALARNVIPTTASAVLDLRLVKGNDVKRQVEKLRAHIKAQGFYVIDREPTAEERLQYPLIAKFTHRAGGYNAQRTQMDLPISLSVIEAVQSTSKEPIVKMPSLGGSLPLSIITENLNNVPTITVPIANYDNNQHAENENIRIQNLWDGIEIYAALMTMKIN